MIADFICRCLFWLIICDKNVLASLRIVHYRWLISAVSPLSTSEAARSWYYTTHYKSCEEHTCVYTRWSERTGAIPQRFRKWWELRVYTNTYTPRVVNGPKMVRRSQRSHSSDSAVLPIPTHIMSLRATCSGTTRRLRSFWPYES